MNQKLIDFNNKLKNKTIAIIGAGVSNLPLLEYLYDLNCNITLFDEKEYKNLSEEIKQIIEKYEIKTSLGKEYLTKLIGFDIIFRSPSCLPTNQYLEEAKKNGSLITTEVEQVIKLAPCKIIGITGSDGKTTTTTLIYELLKKIGYNTYVGGNIGTPLFTKIKDLKENDIVVLELSSFQLMDMEVSPNISVITNISPNHLDIHKDYTEYIDAKKNIFLNQTKDGILILNYDDELVKNFKNEALGEVRYFSNKHKLKNSYILDDEYIKYNDEIFLNTNDLKIKGIHNYINITTALNTIKDFIKEDTNNIKEVLKEFTGVAHRIEFIREINQVKWYNDSASSSPSRTIAGINAFNEDIVLIAGGYDKNIPYEPLARPILDKVSKLILFGDTKNKIYDAVMSLKKQEESNLQIYVVDTLEEVIEIAKMVSKPGEIVLFSPASASFDMFKNAYQRGDIFKELVNKL